MTPKNGDGQGLIDSDGNEIYCEAIEGDTNTETSSTNAYHYSKAPIHDYYSSKQ